MTTTTCSSRPVKRARGLARIPALMPGPLRSLLLGISRVISRAVVRPEAERMLQLISEPILESSAYTNRALRDLEAEVRRPAADVLSMHAFRALAGVPAGSLILVAGQMPALLGDALRSCDYAVTTIGGEDYGALAEGTFGVVLVLDGRDPEPLRRLGRPGGVFFVPSAT